MELRQAGSCLAIWGRQVRRPSLNDSMSWMSSCGGRSKALADTLTTRILVPSSLVSALFLSIFEGCVRSDSLRGYLGELAISCISYLCSAFMWGKTSFVWAVFFRTAIGFDNLSHMNGAFSEIVHLNTNPGRYVAIASRSCLTNLILPHRGSGQRSNGLRSFQGRSELLISVMSAPALECP